MKSSMLALALLACAAAGCAGKPPAPSGGSPPQGMQGMQHGPGMGGMSPGMPMAGAKGAGEMPAMPGMQHGPGMAGMQGMAGMDMSAHVHMPYLTSTQVDVSYRFRVETEPKVPVAGRETLVHVYILDPAGNAVPTLQVHHERLAHFLLVSENLEEFHHLHAEDAGLLTEEARKAGRFSFPVTLASGGRYVLAIDAVDKGFVVHKDIALAVDGPAQGPTRWNFSPLRSQGPLGARLVLSAVRPAATRVTTGTLQLESGGEPVADLQPYLGALMHLAIFREGASESAHNHGGGPEFAPFLRAKAIPGYRGPKLYFEQTFERPGKYRLFAQLQRDATVYTLPFDIEVEPRSAALGLP